MATITEPPVVAPNPAAPPIAPTPAAPVVAPTPAASHVATLPEGVPAASYYRVSLDQYHAMVDKVILHPDDRVELLEGLVVRKMTKNTPHIIASGVMNHFLVRAVPAGWCVIPEVPIDFAPGGGGLLGNAPEPDFAVLRGQPTDLTGRRPGPADVALVIEIADTSLPVDRTTKKTLYARAGIPHYWIVNIPGRRVEVYTDPTGPADLPDYRASRFYGPDEEAPLVIGGQEVGRIAVRDVVPGPAAETP